MGIEDRYQSDLAELRKRLSSANNTITQQANAIARLEQRVSVADGDIQTLTALCEQRQSMVVQTLTERNQSAEGFRETITRLQAQLQGVGGQNGR